MVVDVLGRREIEKLLQDNGLDARRSLGQNFVVDPDAVIDIAKLSGVGVGDRVIEIGPGLGSLTLALAETGAGVLAIEKDESLAAVLNEVLRSRSVGNVGLVVGDALELDWDDLMEDHLSAVLVANLPYNIAVPLIMTLLEKAPKISRMLVMVQAEVADRLAAGPGGRTIGVPSIRLAWYATAERVGTIPPEVFLPQPRVMSALVSIVRHAPPSTSVSESQVMALAGLAYRQRRKMLRSTIGSKVGAAVFERAGIEPTARPEELSIGDWVALTESVLGDPAIDRPA